MAPSASAAKSYSASARGAEVDPRAGPIAELEMAGDEVRVEVGEEDVLDPDAVPLRGVEVHPDVALRVDHGRDAAPLVCDEVRSVRQAAEVVLLEDQGWGTILM